MQFRLIYATGVFTPHTADRFRLFVQQNKIADPGSVAADVISIPTVEVSSKHSIWDASSDKWALTLRLILNVLAAAQLPS